MARSEVLEVGVVWAKLTSEPVISLTVQNRGAYLLELSTTPGTNKSPPQGLALDRHVALINRRVSDLFPGEVVAGQTGDVWARSRGPDPKSTYVFVSHA